MTTGKTIALTTWIFVGKVMSLLVNTLSRFVIAFLPRSKHLLISWLQSSASVILEPKERKSVTVSTFPLSICHEVMGSDAIILVFECLVLSQLFRSPLSPSSRGSLLALHFLPLEWYHLHIWGCWYFSQQSWFQLMLHPAQPFTWYTLYMLNKQGDNIQPWRTPFPILNQFVVSCLVLSIVSCPAYWLSTLTTPT